MFIALIVATGRATFARYQSDDRLALSPDRVHPAAGRHACHRQPSRTRHSLAFPGVFRGALDTRATDITEAMKLAAADAIATLVGSDAEAGDVIPSQFDERVASAVAAAVATQAHADGVARR